MCTVVSDIDRMVGDDNVHTCELSSNKNRQVSASSSQCKIKWLEYPKLLNKLNTTLLYIMGDRNVIMKKMMVFIFPLLHVDAAEVL